MHSLKYHLILRRKSKTSTDGHDMSIVSIFLLNIFHAIIVNFTIL